MTDTNATTTGASPAHTTPSGGPLGPSYRKLFGATVISNPRRRDGGRRLPVAGVGGHSHPDLVALVCGRPAAAVVGVLTAAGVITDRVDRRKTMVAMDVARGALSPRRRGRCARVRDRLPSPARSSGPRLASGGLLLIVLAASLLLGLAEVLRDNLTQTILPNIVEPNQIGTANGRCGPWRGVMNRFAGPPLGSLLLLVAFAPVVRRCRARCGRRRARC